MRETPFYAIKKFYRFVQLPAMPHLALGAGGLDLKSRAQEGGSHGLHLEASDIRRQPTAKMLPLDLLGLFV